MNEPFSEILRAYLAEEQNKNPSTSETAISKKMNIPPTTLNRLANGHSKPTAKTLSKLLVFIPELKNSLPKEISQILKVTLEREEEYVEDTLSTLLSDKYIFLCWCLAFSEQGVTKNEIEKSFGWKGLLALKKLVNKKILYEGKKGFYKVTEGNKDTILSFRLLKAHLMFLAEQYKPDNIKNNYIHYWVEFLDEESRRKLTKAHREFHRTVRSIMENNKGKGDIPVFSIACSDSLLGQDLEEEI